MNAWVRIDAAIDQHPRLEKIGFPAVHVWAFILRATKLHGRGGHLGEDYWDSEWIAGKTGFQQADVERVMAGLAEPCGRDKSPLVQETEDGAFVVKWSRYQADPTAAERSRRYRDKRRSATVAHGSDTGATAVTGTGQDRTGQKQGRGSPHEEQATPKKTSNTESKSTRQDIVVDPEQIARLADGPRAICKAWPGYPTYQAEQTWLAMKHEVPRDWRGKLDLLEVVAEARRSWAQDYDQQKIHNWLRRQVGFSIKGLKDEAAERAADEEKPDCRLAPRMRWMVHPTNGTARQAIAEMVMKYPEIATPEQVREWEAWYGARGGLDGNGNG